MSKPIIVKKEHFEELKQRIKEEGKQKLHVLADFDKTLTKAFIDGKKQETVEARFLIFQGKLEIIQRLQKATA